MNHLVDTNIFSEPVKPTPDTLVLAWLNANKRSIYVSAVTIGELRRGIERMPAGRRKTQLHDWLIALCAQMQGRVLSFNASTAHVWGQWKARWEVAGVVVPAMDSQIAATAHRHGLVLVTRNTADFVRTGVKLHNPFQAV